MRVDQYSHHVAFEDGCSEVVVNAFGVFNLVEGHQRCQASESLVPRDQIPDYIETFTIRAVLLAKFYCNIASLVLNPIPP